MAVPRTKHTKRFETAPGPAVAIPRQENLARFCEMADASPLMIWMSGPDKAGIFFNRAWLDFTGRRLESELGDGWVEAVHADDRSRCYQECLAAFRARRPFNLEFRLRRRDGEYRWIFEMATPRFDEAGRLLGFTGFGIDVTDRRRSEDALRETQERYAVAVRGANDGLWDWHLVSDAAYMSPRWKELLGYRDEELPNEARTFFSHLHPEDRDRVNAAIRRHVEDGRPYEIDHRLQMRNGEYRWFHSRGQTVTDAQGKPVRMAGAITDITIRKEAEDALREREREFHVLADNVPAFFSYVDKDWRYRFVNKRYEQLFQRPAADLVGKPVIEVVGPENFPTVQRNLARAFSGELVRYEYPMNFGDAGPLWMSVTYVPDRDEQNDVRGCFVLVVDVTTLKAAEDAVRRAEEFSRGVLNSLEAHICVLDGDGTIIATNDAWKKFVTAAGAPAHQRIDVGANYFAACHAGVTAGDVHVDGVCEGVRSVLAGAATGFTVEYPAHGPGEPRWFLMRVIPLIGSRGVVISIMNIIERKRMELELGQSQLALREKRQELEVLTGKLLTAQEEERRRLARELHDDFNQRLAALAVGIETLERGRRMPRQALTGELRTLRLQVAALCDDLHDLAYRLHPSLLEHAGLEVAVRDHIAEYAKRTRLTVMLTTEGRLAGLPLNVSTCLFRVLQESLQNVLKHAGASRVEVALSASPEQIDLRVRDNGRGFSPQQLRAEHKGLGMMSMQERLRLLNGKLTIESQPGAGTTVSAQIPGTGEAA